MAFWGTEVKPGKPFTHKFDEVKGRLHLSMATLGLGTATTKSILQCNVGNKSPVYLCSLYPVSAESLQLNLEFEEGVDVIFSVLGPRSVHLSGYYMSGGHQELEPYGEDIADTETERSDESDEDDYEDSFIDDGEPGVRLSSPISSDGGEILYNDKPKKNGKDSRRRLKKTYQMSESDDEGCSQEKKIVNGRTRELVLQSEDEDGIPISSLCKSKSTTKETTEKIEGKADKGTGETNEKKTEDDGNYVIQPKRKADEVVIDDQPKRQSDLPINSMLPSSEVGSENGAKPKKKRKEWIEQSKENKPLKADNANHSNVLKEDKAPIHEARADIMGEDLCLRNGQEWKDVNDKGAELPDNLFLPSTEVSPEDGERPKKKRKERAKKGENSKAESKHTNVVEEDNSQQNKSKADNNKVSEPLNSLLLPPAEVSPEDGEKPKKKRKERLKEGKTSEVDSKGSYAIKEDEAQNDEAKADKDKTANDKEAELPENFSLPSTEVGIEDGVKPKKKSKARGRVVKTSKSDSKHSNVVEEDRAPENETKADNMDQDLPIRDEQDQNPVNDKSLNKDAHEFADENHSEDKKVEKKKKKSKTQEIEDKKPDSKVAASGEKGGTGEREVQKERKRGKKREAEKERKRGEERKGGREEENSKPS